MKCTFADCPLHENNLPTYNDYISVKNHNIKTSDTGIVHSFEIVHPIRHANKYEHQLIPIQTGGFDPSSFVGVRGILEAVMKDSTAKEGDFDVSAFVSPRIEDCLWHEYTPSKNILLKDAFNHCEVEPCNEMSCKNKNYTCLYTSDKCYRTHRHQLLTCLKCKSLFHTFISPNVHPIDNIDVSFRRQGPELLPTHPCEWHIETTARKWFTYFSHSKICDDPNCDNRNDINPAHMICTCLHCGKVFHTKDRRYFTIKKESQKASIPTASQKPDERSSVVATVRTLDFTRSTSAHSKTSSSSFTNEKRMTDEELSDERPSKKHESAVFATPTASSSRGSHSSGSDNDRSPTLSIPRSDSSVSDDMSVSGIPPLSVVSTNSSRSSHDASMSHQDSNHMEDKLFFFTKKTSTQVGELSKRSKMEELRRFAINRYFQINHVPLEGNDLGVFWKHLLWGVQTTHGFMLVVQLIRGFMERNYAGKLKTPFPMLNSDGLTEQHTHKNWGDVFKNTMITILDDGQNVLHVFAFWLLHHHKRLEEDDDTVKNMWNGLRNSIHDFEQQLEKNDNYGFSAWNYLFIAAFYVKGFRRLMEQEHSILQKCADFLKQYRLSGRISDDVRKDYFLCEYAIFEKRQTLHSFYSNKKMPFGLFAAWRKFLLLLVPNDVEAARAYGITNPYLYEVFFAYVNSKDVLLSAQVNMIARENYTSGSDVERDAQIELMTTEKDVFGRSAKIYSELMKQPY
jgi:hypothetical protein